MGTNPLNKVCEELTLAERELGPFQQITENE
jgi:hypothetical protein